MEGKVRIYEASKRIFDIINSLFALIVLSPLLVLVGIMIKLDSPGPIFYRGIRAGKGGKTFRMLKFRTMCQDAEQAGVTSTAEDDARITKM